MTRPPTESADAGSMKMRKSEADALFSLLKDAMREVPYKAIPVDIDGRKHQLQRTAAYIIPPDLAELLKASNLEEELRKLVDAERWVLEPQPDGSINILNRLP